MAVCSCLTLCQMPPQWAALLYYTRYSPQCIVQATDVLYVVYDVFQEVGLTDGRLGGLVLEVGEVDMEVVVGGRVVEVGSDLVQWETVSLIDGFLG